jgi:UDP-N-acetylmuramate--alanine ligase
VIGYGLGEGVDLRAVDVRREGPRTHFVAMRRGAASGLEVTLNLAGLHNVLNSLAAIAVTQEVGIADEVIQRALARFEGIDRRMQHIADVAVRGGSVSIVDDYGHHPVEIAATLDAVRQAYGGRRVVLAFQPHRYTRTRDLLDDFASVLAGADTLLVTEVYAAGEAPIAGADARAICRAVRSRGRVEPVFVEKVDELPRALAALIEAGDVIVMMGAGNISAVAHELPARLAMAGSAH